MSDVVDVSVIDVSKFSSVMPVLLLERDSSYGVLIGAVCTTGLNLTD